MEGQRRAAVCWRGERNWGKCNHTYKELVVSCNFSEASHVPLQVCQVANAHQ